MYTWSLVLNLFRARACAHDDVVPAVTGTGWRLGNCSMFSHELMLLTSLIVVNNALSRRWRPYSMFRMLFLYRFSFGFLSSQSVDCCMCFVFSAWICAVLPERWLFVRASPNSRMSKLKPRIFNMEESLDRSFCRKNARISRDFDANEFQQKLPAKVAAWSEQLQRIQTDLEWRVQEQLREGWALSCRVEWTNEKGAFDVFVGSGEVPVGGREF